MFTVEPPSRQKDAKAILTTRIRRVTCKRNINDKLFQWSYLPFLRIIKAIDQLGDRLTISEGRRARIVTESFELEVWNLSNSTSKDVSVGLELQTEGDTAVDGIGDGKLVTLFDSTSRDYQLTDTAIMLPGSFVRQLAEGLFLWCFTMVCF